jgi:Purple acid Phosphatase, N-terminal domain
LSEARPSTGIVAPRVEQQANGVLDPTYWEGLDATSQGAVAEALPQPPQNEAEWQHQVEANWETSPDAPNLTGLTAADITATGATVTWTTDEPATSQVRWGTAAGSYAAGTPMQGDLVTAHSVPLTGLSPATAYFVQAGSRGAGGNLAAAETQFTTLAAQE